jgi:hypothetical protein
MLTHFLYPVRMRITPLVTPSPVMSACMPLITREWWTVFHESRYLYFAIVEYYKLTPCSFLQPVLPTWWMLEFVRWTYDVIVTHHVLACANLTKPKLINQISAQVMFTQLITREWVDEFDKIGCVHYALIRDTINSCFLNFLQSAVLSWWVLKVVRWGDDDPIPHDPLRIRITPLKTPSPMMWTCMYLITREWLGGFLWN